MPETQTTEQALVAAAARLGAAWESAERDPRADSAADAELASDLLALAARVRVREVEALPADQRPVGWDEKDSSAPPLPEGEYARVEILGHDSHTGWVTDSTRAGAPVMVIRDWDGRVIAEIPGQSLYRFVPLATPLRRPAVEPLTRAALPPSRGGFDPEYEFADDADDLDDETEGRPF